MLGLGAHQRHRAQYRVDRGGAERAGELADAVLDHLVERGCVVEFRLVRRDAWPLRVRSDPQAMELRNFFPESHRGDQRVNALLAAALAVLPRLTRQAFG